MADEYIRKQDAIEALAKTMPTPATPDGAGEFDHEIHIADEAFADAIRIIESIEPADVISVVHAHWIRHENADVICGYEVPMFECSKCRAWKEDDSDFCPDCGAKMDAQGEE